MDKELKRVKHVIELNDQNFETFVDIKQQTSNKWTWDFWCEGAIKDALYMNCCATFSAVCFRKKSWANIFLSAGGYGFIGRGDSKPTYSNVKGKVVYYTWE